MTKYVLNSGGTKNQPELARDFFAEVLSGLGSKPKFLICCFAQPREDWEEKFNKDILNTGLLPDGITPQFDLAFPDTFKDQVEKNDAMYIHGGDDHLVQYWLKQFELPKMWDGKVVATNSASSNALAKHFWTCDWRQPMDGLGILPIRFLSHFESDYGNNDLRGAINWKEAYKQLEGYGDITLPIHALREGEYVVIEQ